MTDHPPGAPEPAAGLADAVTDHARGNLSRHAGADTGPVESRTAAVSAPAASRRLADHTTFRIGGPADQLVVASSEAELIGAVSDADQSGRPLLLLGGGSNVLVGDAGFRGTVVLVATRGCRWAATSGGVVTVAAGEVWDDFVAQTLLRGYGALAALSGIPGSVGAAPVQNIGAYGAEVAETIQSVRAFDRRRGEVTILPAAECAFGYRTSRFKSEPDRYAIVDVDFFLRPDDAGAPPGHPELADRLGLAPGQRPSPLDVRQAVLELRRSKGMLLDPADHDTWSAGSFFTNPLLTGGQAKALPPEAPRYPQPDGTVKTSAAWLIAQAGFARGHGPGPARLSTKHVLALTNRGGATAADILALARTVRDAVSARFAITLTPEPTLVGCALS